MGHSVTKASTSDTMVKSDAEWVDLSNKQLEIEATVGGVKKKLSGVTNGPDIHAPIEPIPDNDWTGETWGLFWPDQEMEERSEDPTKYIKKHYEDKTKQVKHPPADLTAETTSVTVLTCPRPKTPTPTPTPPPPP